MNQDSGSSTKPNWSLLFYMLFFLVIAFSAFVMLLWGTGIYGIGISPDSTIYLDTAKNLIAGNGFTAYSEPMTHYPPFYPMILVISGIINSNLVHSARWLHAIIYGVNAFLFGFLIYLSSSRNRIAAILSIFLFISSSEILKIHIYAWSESPFITFSLLSFLFFFLYSTTSQSKYLLLTSITLCLAIATRYVGLSLLPPIIILLILFDKQTIKKKVINLFLVVFLSLFPIIIWMLRNLLIIHSLTDRKLVFHPISTSRIISDSINAFHSFIRPNFATVWANAIEILTILCVFVFFSMIVIRNRSSQNIQNNMENFFIYLGTLSFVSYFIFIIFSITFVDANTPLDQRILFPAYLFIAIAIFSAVFINSNGVRIKYGRACIILYIIFLILTNIIPMTDFVYGSRSKGLGYNSIDWIDSPTIYSLTLLDPKLKIYTNARDVISFRTTSLSQNLPKSANQNSLISNNNYNNEIISMCESVEKGDAFIVFFDSIKRWYFPTKVELMQKCNLPIRSKQVDGMIFGINRK